MREIKFRLWVEMSQSYADDAQYFASIDKDGSLNTFNTIEDVIPEQFTGLKDKNSVEIYEGDIIKNNKGDVSFIIYSKNGFKTNSYFGGGIKWYNQEFEVIGNIHQNPELLK